MIPGETLTRRDLLRRSAGAGLAAAPFLASLAQAKKSPYGPFKMGLQSYSLRAYKLEQALEHTRDLGVRYWEAYSAHVPLTTDASQASGLLRKLDAAGVRLLAHGVSGFGANRDENRKVFEGAKALGVRTISADPAPESFDHLDELVEEFKINIAIHNHGPGSRYDKLQQVVDAVKGRHKRIGACVDTGHFLRSREDPVRVIETLGARVHGVHLKDVKNATQFTILGKGDMDTPGVLRALRRLKFNGVLALEYEENEQNPIADIRESLAVVRAAVAKL
ncbi:MAG TPA: sugar phosphate isomerase/epimerase [Armatimonadota bacterium]|nr:sugar phosphate isomerase/epimerase [Armatimonadota bacterium]